MATIVRGSILAAAAKCVSDEPARPAINGVWVGGDGSVCSTNGHILFRAKPSADCLADYPACYGDGGDAFNGEGIILPASVATAAAKNAKGIKLAGAGAMLRDRVVIVKRDGAQSEATSTDLDSIKREQFRRIECQWPSVEQVIPKGEPVLRIGLSLSSLETLCAAFKAAGVETRSSGGQLTFEFHGPLSAATIRAVTTDAQEVMALIMPLRLPA